MEETAKYPIKMALKRVFWAGKLVAGVGFEQKKRVFLKLTTPQLPPYHQRRTAS
jgi:hypothetical protein